MHELRPAKITSPIVTLGGAQIKTIPLALIVGAIGIGAALFLSMGSEQGMLKRFSHIYLVNYAFLLTMCLGCLFFVTISHLTRAGWNVTVRRIAELYAMCLVPMAILFLPILIPVLIGMDDLYIWNAQGWSTAWAMSPEQADSFAKLSVDQLPPMEQLKIQFLNPNFFAVRWVVYFTIWGTMAWYFLSRSLKQDQLGDKTLTSKMQAFSAPAMIIFAGSLVFSSFDLLMSLEPLWFSTMFPVYFFAGSMLSALALIALTALWMQRSGRVTDEITTEHYHDLGKMMHGFIVFWGYIAFSQFMLIWYANIPEETFWYRYRMDGSWATLSIILIVGHLFVPFLAAMGRTMRRNRKFMTFITIYLLCMHWIDMYWLVMPQCDRSAHAFTFSSGGILIDLACTVGMIGLFIAIFCLVTRDKPLVPLQDPRLGEALNHEVH